MDDRIVTIEKVVFGGKGLSRDLEKVTFVPFTLPGETARIRIKKQHHDYLEADVLEIIQPSPDRVPPECGYFGICGGCSLSHAGYPAQVRLKLGMLRESMSRAGIQHPPVETVAAEPTAYRHRAQLKYDSNNRALGFFRAETNRVVDIQECLCLAPGLNGLLKALRNALTPVSVAGLSGIECFENDRGETAVYFNARLPDTVREQLSGVTKVFDSTEKQFAPLTIRFREKNYPMHPDIFLQVNPRLWKAMIQEVESHHPNSTGMTAVELYCGAGFFTVPLSNLFKNTIACEENPAAIRYARENHSHANVKWICEKAENLSFPVEAEVVILDPPRTGLHRKVIRQLIERRPARISYISCDCSSFARDVKKLDPYYLIDKITLMDLFPQTFHFETIALLEKRR